MATHDKDKKSPEKGVDEDYSRGFRDGVRAVNAERERDEALAEIERLREALDAMTRTASYLYDCALSQKKDGATNA